MNEDENAVLPFRSDAFEKIYKADFENVGRWSKKNRKPTQTSTFYFRIKTLNNPLGPETVQDSYFYLC